MPKVKKKSLSKDVKADAPTARIIPLEAYFQLAKASFHVSAAPGQVYVQSFLCARFRGILKSIEDWDKTISDYQAMEAYQEAVRWG